MNKAQIRHDATCNTCRYFLEQEHGMGACHRYPPSFAGEQTARELHRWRFPLVPPSSWCGEHKPVCLDTPDIARDGR